MKFIADFHIHSHFSIATSRQLCPEYLDHWARIKGIKVIGTGDFTHPGWIDELKEKLEPAEQGLFRLKEAWKIKEATVVPENKDNEVRFLLTAEISNIYKKKGKVRKVHNVVFAPDFDTVDKIQHKLSSLGFNITSDGRPILGMDSRDLLELCLDVSDQILFVPAHIWTPWFSALGAKSGFDSIDACYDDLCNYIYTVETGLSSDPAMNWMCSFLDRYTLISNSDAHSPQKLGREANLLDTALSYPHIVEALKPGHTDQFKGTLEFFPQEGKYHYDGHRKCGICWDPVETLKNDSICSSCGKSVTVGVMNRVVQLSDRENVYDRKNQIPFYSLIPLQEILSEIYRVGSNSKRVFQAYTQLIRKSGSEFNVLVHASIEEIEKVGGELLAEAVRRMRCGNVHIQDGFDGEFGVIRVFSDSEVKNYNSQSVLFQESGMEKSDENKQQYIRFNLTEYRQLQKEKQEKNTVLNMPDEIQIDRKKRSYLQNLNNEQQRAVCQFGGPALIIAGPGTGKTQVLTRRIAYLIYEKEILPENILAVTFTNKAAKEIDERLKHLLKGRNFTQDCVVCTFHAFGNMVLRKHAGKVSRTDQFLIINEEDKGHILKKITGFNLKRQNELSNAISLYKQKVGCPEIRNDDFLEIIQKYEDILQKENIFDLDDLISKTLFLLKKHPEILEQYQNQFQWILIDEYQDINQSQYELVRCLMPYKQSNIYVIGDPDQAIYGFRGADVRFIHHFCHDYPSASVYRLNKSYRCSDAILRASSEILGEQKSGQSILSGIHSGVRIKIIQQASEKSEAEFVARTIEQMMGGLRFFSMDSDITEGEKFEEIQSFEDFAVLCRIGRQMKVLEKAFNDHNIPFQIVGETPFFRKEPMQTIITLFKLWNNPDNSFSRRALNNSGWTNQRLETICNEKNNKTTVRDRVQMIMDHYFDQDQYEKGDGVRFLELAESFGNDDMAFLEFVTMGMSPDTYRSGQENVALMTIHGAKGLEFQCVFIVGCEEGLLPYSFFNKKPYNTNEEERLLYVGMTRAKKHLFLTHAKKRFFMGKIHEFPRSSFLNRIEDNLIEFVKQEYKRSKKITDNQIRLF